MPWSTISSAGAGSAWQPDHARCRPGWSTPNLAPRRDRSARTPTPRARHPHPETPKAAREAVSPPKSDARSSETEPEARYAAWGLVIGIDCR